MGNLDMLSTMLSERGQESGKKKKGLARVLRSQHGTILHESRRKMQEGGRGRGRGGTTILQYSTAY
jgi:hypothetical protein